MRSVPTLILLFFLLVFQLLRPTPVTGLALLLLLCLLIGGWLADRMSQSHLALSANAQARGKGAIVQLTIQNDSLFPVLPLAFHLTIQNDYTGERREQTVYTALPPRGSRLLRLETVFPVCGRISVHVDHLQLLSSLLVLPVSCPAVTGARTLLLPELATGSLAGERPAAEAAPDRLAADAKGPDLSETFQVRPYREGDSTRSIHWKLSGKFDEPVVRDGLKPEDDRLLLVMDRHLIAADPQHQVKEELARLTLRAASDLCARQIPFRLFTNDCENDRLLDYPVRSVEELAETLPTLLGLTSGQQGESCAALLSRAGVLREGDTLLYVSDDPEEAEALLAPFPCTHLDARRVLAEKSGEEGRP